ncbi:hypothetical protein L2E82_45277 [Cichorium intybus]|uniref:Uncharacterized protein n=1 Tax=Cichorium intybus TaxID=13427 RepID=A0ACB8ZSJ3_CICIN|nr:hypothetical protein L2E82_45277 [Cichorium intybus]
MILLYPNKSGKSYKILKIRNPQAFKFEDTSIVSYFSYPVSSSTTVYIRTFSIVSISLLSMHRLSDFFILIARLSSFAQLKPHLRIHPKILQFDINSYQ